MTPPSLPDAGPFRVFPTRGSRQTFVEDARACAHCLGGACCQSEDAIYLTALDVLRLAAFLDLSPGDFLLRFTQERFAEGPLEPYRRATLDDPNGSVVTYLRRRSNRSFSPCIFLKYVRDTDGTPRRICAVHPARPLACREYYHHHCKTRATGELAALQAHAFEMVREGAVTIELARTQRQRLRPLLTPEAPMSAWLEYSVWTEAWRALHLDAANEEGVDSYAIAEYQDALDLKLNRLLSKRLVRLEERYGWIPSCEQLDPFDAGGAFARSPDRARLMRLVETPPSRRLFEDGDYPFFAANRLTVAGMRRPRRFPLLGDAGKRRLLPTAPDAVPFATHRDPRVRATTSREIWSGALSAADALVTFASYVASLGQVLEQEPPGTFEVRILWFLRRLDAVQHPAMAVHPGIREVSCWAKAMTRGRSRRMPPAPLSDRSTSPAQIRRLLDTQQADGSWADLPARMLPDSQAEYLRRWLDTTATGLLVLRVPASE